ncbi:YcaO-like family protein [uncultured Alsobacter sp.]|uniref:YcaO-like family protein n=1 Tax=uncultured Alsobacter sp. TaxID=1748258 RepID=UPI0025D130EA|nr:YcaO-like family protein [uncultured Alsobacter sp.]
MIDEVVALQALRRLAEGQADDRAPPGPQALLASLLRRRAAFGITRVGSVTRLGRIGLPVVQAVRPLALSNAVTQGKGTDSTQAALSAVLEAIETWAAERAPDRAGPPRAPADDEIETWSSLWPDDGPPAGTRWIQAVDLLDGRAGAVPLALVDTVYTLPSPHPSCFVRTTTGLGAGPTWHHAATHAALECVEREALWRARRRPHFFDRHQVDIATAAAPVTGLVHRLHEAGLVVGAWRVPAPLPVYWCHVMEDGRGDEFAPLPAEGFGCDLTEGGALMRAVLEACQARLTAIAAAREDLTSDRYAPGVDREQLARWRLTLASGSVPVPVEAPMPEGDRLSASLQALRLLGARRVMAVPLADVPELPLAVVRVVAPPLHTDPREGRYGV